MSKTFTGLSVDRSRARKEGRNEESNSDITYHLHCVTVCHLQYQVLLQSDLVLG